MYLSVFIHYTLCTLNKSLLFTVFIAVQKAMEFKVILFAVVVSLYVTEAVVKRDKMLGGADYLPCESCNIPKSDYPEEG